jgi:hypothetical protein
VLELVLIGGRPSRPTSTPSRSSPMSVFGRCPTATITVSVLTLVRPALRTASRMPDDWPTAFRSGQPPTERGHGRSFVTSQEGEVMSRRQSSGIDSLRADRQADAGQSGARDPQLVAVPSRVSFAQAGGESGAE